MTPNDFRKLALALPETEERAHMNHPDFRVAGKIFATLGYPDKSRAMVKLPPEQQHYLSKDHPEAFIPVNGVWGRRGATSIVLKAADKDVVRQGHRSRLAQHRPEALAEGKNLDLTRSEPPVVSRFSKRHLRDPSCPSWLRPFFLATQNEWPSELTQFLSPP